MVFTDLFDILMQEESQMEHKNRREHISRIRDRVVRNRMLLMDECIHGVSLA